MSKTRLELTWIGKDKRPRLEPRILLEDKGLSYHAKFRHHTPSPPAPLPQGEGSKSTPSEQSTEQKSHCAEQKSPSPSGRGVGVRGADIFDNKLIFGDNLLALKALEQNYAGKVKCVYIDPPFNTQQAFEHYDDGLEHSLWLGLIRDRLECINGLLASDGTLFVHIDDNELGYLIVILDEIFGRSNRVAIVTFKQGSATGHKSINPGVVSTSNFLLVYAKKKSEWKPNRIFTARDERDKRYSQVIENYDASFSEWRFITLTEAFAASLKLSERGLKKALGTEYEELLTEFVINNAKRVVRLARPDYNAVSNDARNIIDESRTELNTVLHLERTGYSDMYFVKGERILFYSDKLKLVDGQYVAGEPLTSIWDDILSNNLHNEGSVEFPKGKKPEALIKRCLELATNPNDLVLDSFAGSGTTGAVAHKMGRRWIMIELGEHCHTHIIPRLKKVIDGEDQGGISKAVNWQGGGGFRYYRLAPSLLEQDRWGNWVVNKNYHAAMLAEALCKMEGFSYAPSDSQWWQHGYSSEQDFIYVTTQNLSHLQLQDLSDEVGGNRTLLVCCAAFRGKPDAFFNLTLKKIPKMVLSRCEWGHDDYSLNVANLPMAQVEVEPVKTTKTSVKAVNTAQDDLFEFPSP